MDVHDGYGAITGNKIKIIPKKKYNDDAMMNVKNSYDRAFKILPSAAKTKISIRLSQPKVTKRIKELRFLSGSLKDIRTTGIPSTFSLRIWL